MRVSVTWLSAALILPLGACAPISEDERYERENRMILVKELYSERSEWCAGNGGAMSMRARTVGQPDYLDYKTARCVMH
jgi:hypothetical protein